MLVVIQLLLSYIWCIGCTLWYVLEMVNMMLDGEHGKQCLLVLMHGLMAWVNVGWLVCTM